MDNANTITDMAKVNEWIVNLIENFLISQIASPTDVQYSVWNSFGYGNEARYAGWETDYIRREITDNTSELKISL